MSQASHKQRTLLWGSSLLILLLVVVALMVQPLLSNNKDTQAAALREAGIIVLPEPRALPELSFQSSAGGEWLTADLAGRWSLVFFGYTYCPDICPTTLAELAQLQRSLPDSVRDKVQVLMVSVDPNRDTPQQLNAYLNFFDADFTGVVGSMPDIQTLSQTLSIPFIPGDIEQPGYTVDHSGNLAIVSPDGQQFGFVHAPLNVAQLAEQLPTLIAP